MKNILTVLFISLLFTQCTKDDSKVFNARFYTTETGQKLSLYVDGAYRGELPYFAQAPECGAVYSDGNKPLQLSLPSGQYRLTGRNAQGDVVSQSTIRISRSKLSTSGNIGGASLINKEDCLTIGLWD